MSWKEKAQPVKKSWRDSAMPVSVPEAVDPSSWDEYAETGARSMIDGLTLGASEPVFSGINAGVDVATDYLFGMAPKDKGIIEQLKSAYNEDVDKRRGMQAAMPKTDIGGKVTGALLPVIATLGGAAPASAGSLSKAGYQVATSGSRIATGGANLAKGAVELVPGVAKLAAQTKGLAGVGGAVARTGISAAEGAGSVLASEGVSRLIKHNTGFAREGDNEADLSDLVKGGAKFGAAFRAVPEAGKFMSWGGKKLLSTLFMSGNSAAAEEAISKYIANPEAVRSAKSLEQIKDEIDTAVQNIKDDVEKGVLSYEDAKEATKVATNALTEHLAENRALLRDQKFDLKMAAKEAKNMADDAVRTFLEPIKNVKPPTNLADDVVEAVGDLKRNVVKGSQEAYDILGKQKGKVNIAGLDEELAQQQDALKVAGKEIIGETARRSNKAIQDFRDRLSALPKRISMSEAKKLIQQLDRDVKWVRSTGEFSDEASNAMKGVRSAIDERLKDVPAYADKMKEVAENTRLLEDANAMFGESGKAISKLSSIDGAAKVEVRDVLDRLGKSTGRDFKSPLQTYIDTKMLGKSQDALDELTGKLPEVQAAEKAQAAYQRTLDPRFGQDVMEHAATQSRPAVALSEAQQAQQQAEKVLGEAKAKYAPFSTVTPATSENFIKSVMSPNNFELKKKMASLGQVSDKDFVSMIDNMKTAQAFTKDATRGSRNVNFWTFVSGLSGYALTGDPLYAAVGLGGAGFGAVADKYGPQMTKKILDGYVGVKGWPTLQKIDRAYSNLPAPVIQELKADLIRAVTASRSGGPVMVPESERAQLSSDVRDSGMTNVEKAKILDSLNRSGSIDENDMVKLMVGENKPSEAAKFILGQ